MTEIAETPSVVRDTVSARLDEATKEIQQREAVINQLTRDIRIEREALVRAQIDAENLTIWLERNDQ